MVMVQNGVRLLSGLVAIRTKMTMCCWLFFLPFQWFQQEDVPNVTAVPVFKGEEPS